MRLRVRKSRAKDKPEEEEPELDTEQVLSAFEVAIADQERVLYGVALFFEGVSLLQAGQEAVIETYQKQCRNVIQAGQEAIQVATSLLEQARENEDKAALIGEFKFYPCQGYPEPEELTRRARLLVDTYDEIFPDRPRDQEFEQSETLQLTEAAAMLFE